MMSTAARLFAAASTAVLALAAGPAQAQEDAGVQSAQLEEIVVTAQRRSERLQDVPMSITALSAESLQKSGVTSTSDLARVAPSVAMPSYGAFLQPAIRGVSSTGANIGDNSNVAMYIDGVYQPQQIATLLDLPDVQQVEILKGPQGALYGQNATGGAILVTSRAPSFTPGGFLSGSYGNYNATNLRGFVTGPLTDKVAASLAAGFQQRDGFRKHVLTGERDDGLESKVARGKVLFQPVEKVDLTLTGYYSDLRDSAPYAGFALDGNSVGFAIIPGVPRASGPKQFEADPGVFTHIKSYGANLHGAFGLEAGTVSSITGYFRNQASYKADADFSPVDFTIASTPSLNAHYFMQDLNFVSRKFGRATFLVGGFYMNGAETFNTSDFTMRVPSLFPAPQGPVTMFFPQYGRIKKEVWAVYGDVTFDITDQLILTAGGRYTEEEQRARSNSPTGFMGDVEYPGGPQSWSQFTPRVTLRYELTPSSNVYASWGKGFKSGIINSANFSQPPVDPEKITAYEVGFKGRPISSLTLNAAAFWYDYKDLQVVAYAPPDYIQQNAASARIKGVDLDASWAVASWLTLSAGAAFLDAQYRDFPAAQIFVPTGFGGNDAVTADLSGLRMLRAPRFTGNFAVDYHRDTELGRFGAFASAYYNSGYGFEVSNRVKSGAYALYDAELSFEPVRYEGLRLVLWGKNLGNADYLGTFLTSNFADGATYAPPRTFGVRAEYQF